MTKTGIFHWFGYIQPFEERIELIKEAGYDYVMLWWDDEVFPRFIDRRDLIKIVNSYGLKLDNVHLPFDNKNFLWNENSEIRLRQTDLIKQWMNECKNSGAEKIVMHTTHGGNLVLNYKFGFESFNSIIKEADNIKLKVALENTQMFEYTDFLLKEFDSKYVGFCYDSSHDFVNGQSCGEILDKWKDKLFAVHLSDNDGICDRHWIPGKGHVNWSKIINLLKQTNIKTYSMEAYPFEEEKDLKPLDFLIKARSNLLLKL
jgi:sugar phosphate isomerase/epimerase